MSLYDDASLIMYPSGYKEDKLYSLKPTNGDGDFTFTRASTATRVNDNGLIETVAIDTPRIDYTGGGCGSLLLEKQSTNLALESESLISLPWFSGTGTENADIAPDGTQSATLITNLLTRQNISVTVQPYTVSVFIKGSVFRLELGSVFGSNCFVIFNTSTETFTSVGTSVENYGFEKYINGWYRIFLTDTPANSGIGQVQLKPVGGLEMLIWGAQFEQGSYPTSYIPTSGAAATRVADSASKTGLSSVINSPEGVFYYDCVVEGNENGCGLTLKNTGSVTDRVDVGFLANLDVRVIYTKSGVNEFISSVTTYAIGQNLKIAIKWALNDLAVWVNGVEVATDTTGINPITAGVLNELVATTSTGSLSLQNLMVFPSALTDSELETLTTL